MTAIPYIESPFFAEHFPGSTEPELLRVAQSLHESGYAIIDLNDPEFDRWVAAM